MTRQIGVVTGLASEFSCLDDAPASAVLDRRVVGADAGRARDAALAMVAAGCVGLVSFGTAGGLDPKLRPGAVVVGEAVWSEEGGLFETDAKWRRRVVDLLEAVSDVHSAVLAGSPTAVRAIADKRQLQARSGAIAVDMESHAVARVAVDKGVPFLAIRAVVDDARSTVPTWLMGLVRTDGTIRGGATIAGLIAHPGDIPTLIRLGSGSGKAHAALRRVALALGADFGFDRCLLG